MSIEVRNKRIEGTDIYIFSKDPVSKLFTYSRSMSADEATTIAHKVPGLKVINNSLAYMSTLRGIKANRELMAQSKGNVWFPTIQEGLLLHDAQLLPSGELMDFGIALYSAGNPDKQIAEALCKTAKDKGWKLPVLASFKSLDSQEGGERYDFTPVLVSEDGLIAGEDATDILKKFTYAGDSGVRRLNRYSFGDWVAYWGGSLVNSFGDCRVGRVSAVGSTKNLKELIAMQVKQNYTDSRIQLQAQLEKVTRDINIQIQNTHSLEQKTIESAEKILA